MPEIIVWSEVNFDWDRPESVIRKAEETAASSSGRR
jgi:hypothetical protein